jgi:CHAT domain-containing protein/Tfp pilus assembly protein PilF
MEQYPMRYVAKWLGLVATTAVMLPFAEISGFFAEPWGLMPAAIAQSVEERKAEADQLRQQGIQLFNVGQVREAMQLWEQALEIYQDIGDRGGEGTALGNLGNAYLRLGDYRQAIDFYEKSLAIAREIGDRRGEGNALGNLGIAYGSLGDYRQAIDFYEQVLAIFREIGDRGGEGTALGNLGNAYRNLGDYRQAIDFYEQHLVIARDLGDRAGEGRALGNLGNAYRNLGDYRQAIDFHEQSLIIFREIGDRGSEGAVLGNLGLAYDSLGDYRQAIDFHEQRLAIAREIEDRGGEGRALGNLGNAYLRLGNYRQAIDFYEQSLAITREIGDRSGEGNALSGLGSAYLGLGDYRQAIAFYEQHLMIAREIGDRGGEGVALGNLGAAYFSLGDYRQAITFFEQNLAIAREIGDRGGEGAALGNLGSAYSSLGNYRQAIEVFEQRLAIAREISDRGGEGRALGNLGNAYLRLGNYRQAIDFYEQSLAITREIGNRTSEGHTLGNLGLLFDQQGNPDLAIVFLKASVDVRESIRGDIRGLDTALQQSFTDTVAGSYRRLANLLLSQGRIPEAQQVLDLLQLEELREFTNTRAAWTGTALAYTPVEQPIIRVHGDLIAFGQEVAACRRTNCPDLGKLNRQLTALNEQYQTQVATFQDQVRQNRRDDDIFQDPSRLGSDARALLAANPNSVLIYPFVTEDKLWLLWATSGAVGTVEVAVSQAELSQAVQQLGERLTRAGNLNDLQAASQRLYDWLVRPLEAPLEANNIEKLIFVNDRVTRYIPMAVLFDGERYLLERYTLSTVLSPAVTNTTSRLGAVDEAPVLGLGLTQAFPGFDPLPAVKDELTGIVRGAASPGQGIFPGSVFFDGDFTLDTLETNLLGHRVLHIATHAAFVPGRPRDSYILLGDGSRLDVADIEAREHLLDDLHLVVLSACQTALGGSAGDGSEIAGISSYFLAPGRAETVIASLWKVNDNSTSVLMQRFYELLATGDLTKAEALRQAQLSLLYNEDAETRLAAARGNIVMETRDGTPLSAVGSQHPYHWAPFILIGNGL